MEHKNISEIILSYYKNNCELKDNMTEYEKGYLKALFDVQAGKIKICTD